MGESRVCEIDRCDALAVRQCARCGRALCQQHLVTDYQHLPGGQRPYCQACDVERRQIYQRVRTQGARVIAWSLGGAVVGAITGFLTSAAITPDSFTHTVATDLGFVAGLALALLGALSTAKPGDAHRSSGHRRRG